MKKDIHPEYYQAEVVCAGCKTSFTVGSTLAKVSVSICSACHPFYTGKQTLVDSEGRVDRFRRQYGKVASSDSDKSANA